MCHHLGDEEGEKWLDDHEREEDLEREETEQPSFANEDSDVEVDLLDADD